MGYQYIPGSEYGPPWTFIVFDGDDRKSKTIDWSIDACNDRRVFEVSYRITGAVKVYKDTADLYHQAVAGKNEQEMDRVTATVKFPQGAEKYKQWEEILIWGHGPANGYCEFKDENTATWVAENLQPKTYFEMRILLPQELFPDVPATERINKNKRKAIIKKEESQFRWDDIKYAMMQYLPLAIIILGTILSLIITVYFWINHVRQVKPKFQDPYQRELPDESNPAEVAVFLGGNPKIKPDTISATLMDLIRRKVLSFEQLPGRGRKSDFLFKLNREKYKSSEDQLQPYEKHLIKYVFGIISEDKASIALSDIEKHLDHYPKKFHLYFWEVWERQLNNKVYVKNEWYTEKAVRKNMPNVIGVVIFFLAFVLTYVTYNMMYLWLFLAAGGWFIVGRLAPKRTEEGNELYHKWLAFKKFLLDFSNMHEHGIRSIELWEHYMVYATALGIARKVLRQLRVAIPNFDDQYMKVGGTAAIMTGIHHGCFDRMNRGFSQARSTATRATRSGYSGGGGGFSTGGGGGGGGGSYGGR